MSIAPPLSKEAGLDSDPKHWGLYLHTRCHNLPVCVVADYSDEQNSSGKDALFRPLLSITKFKQ